MSHKNSKGQSLIEFIIAIGILVIVGGSGAIAVLGSLTATRLAKERTQATGFALEGIEAVKSIRNQGWENMVNGTHGLTDSQGFWEFSGNSDTLGAKYTRTIILEDTEVDGEVISEAKKVTSTVFWNYTPTRPNQVQYVTYLTDWKTVKAVAPGGSAYGTCNDYCASLGFTSGTCSPNPTQCTHYLPYADQFCLGGPSEDTCCCSE